MEVFVEPFDFIKKGEKILVYSDDETPKRLASFLVREKSSFLILKKPKLVMKLIKTNLLIQ